VEQTDDVLRLLRALMEISEAEAGMLRLEKTACDLGDLARGAVELYAEVAEAKPVALTAEADGPVPVLADSTRLRQAVANLVDNAVKYTPAGGRVIVRAATVGRARGAEDGGSAVAEAMADRLGTGDGRPGMDWAKEAVLTVRDTGPGVAPGEQTRIWERLYRGDASRSQRGLGLGLSLVRVIVEAHGGTVTQRNAAEGGAIFELRLPLAVPAAVMPAAVAG
jgi:signal transduction histidine kinase